jgi:two-component system NarL family sensor kinase
VAVETDAEMLRRRNRELSILNAIAQALNSSVDLGQTLRSALAKVADLLDLQTGWVWLLHDEDGESYLAAEQSLPPALTVNPRRMEGRCYCLRTFLEGDLEGAANTNVVECSRLQGLVDGTDGLRFHASIPLYAHGKKMGVMNVASKDWRELSAADLQLLDTVGDLTGIAVERAQLFAHSVQLGALKERNRLAREIHDTLAQGLTAVSLQLESADALLESSPDPARARKAVQMALSLTRASLEEARRSVLDLRAAPLEGRSLPEALTALAGDTGLQVNCAIIGDNRPLAPSIEVGLYRIAQEALANIEQHAQATRIEIQLAMSPSEIRLIVEDDGRGFDPESIPADRYGLVGMNERVRLLDGRLILQSVLGSGTRLEAVVPSPTQSTASVASSISSKGLN